MNVGEKIRHYRKQAGLTSEQLAKKMGMSGGSYVIAYENNRRIPGRKTLQKFADALGINVFELEDDNIAENFDMILSGNRQRQIPSDTMSWLNIESDYCNLSEQDKETIALAEKYTNVFNHLEFEEKKQLVNFCSTLLDLEQDELNKTLTFILQYASKLSSLTEKERKIIELIFSK